MTAIDMRKLETNIESMAFGVRWIENPGGTGIGKGDGKSLKDDPKIRALKDKNKRQVQAPPLPAEKEAELTRFKSEVLSLYKNYKPPRVQNLTKQERDTVHALQNRSDIIIKQSDKSKCFVVMDIDTYTTKAEELLSDQLAYEKSSMTAEELERLTIVEIEKLRRSQVKDEIINLLRPHNTKLAEFYGLPKTHKTGTPLRPVVSACNTPTTAVSIVLERILNQLLPCIPAHLSDTQDALSRVKRTLAGLKDCQPIVLSMDVVALYPSIPIDEGIDIVMEFLQQTQNDIDMLACPCRMFVTCSALS